MTQKRKFVAVLITLAIVVAQLAIPMTAFAAAAGTAKLVLEIPSNVTLDSTNGAGKTASEYNGMVITMKRGVVTSSSPTDTSMNSMTNFGDPVFDNAQKFEYLFTSPGTYTIYSRGPGYYRTAKMFNITQENLDNGDEIFLTLPNGPLGEQGYQPGQWQTFAERKAVGYTGSDYIPQSIIVDEEVRNVTVNIDSRDQVVVIWPEEIRARFDVTPEAFAFQKAASGNTNVPKFPYPAGGLDSVVLGNIDNLALLQIAPMEMLEEWIDAKLSGFTQGTNGVYVYQTSLCHSPVYDLNMPFLVFAKESALATAQTLEEAAAILRANGKPTIWHQGSIHANEPAGTEGVTAVMSELLGAYGAEALNSINVILLPRVSVDSARFFSRATFFNADPNREHLNADSPEQVAIHKAFNIFMPELATDGHEFNFGGASSSGNTGYMTSADDLETTEAGQMNVSDELQALSVKVNDLVHQNALDAGLRVTHYGPAVSPAVGRAYYNMLGTITILVEVRGIGAGGAYNHMARRAYAQYVSLLSVEQYAIENAQEVMETVWATRESLVERGEAYNPEELISLNYTRNTVTYTAATTPRLLPRYSINFDGTMRSTTTTGSAALGTYYRSTKDRTRPTAYVMSLDAPNLAKIRKVLDAQSIRYYIVAPGTEVEKLSQYYWISGTGTTNWNAGLRSEGSVTFNKGALIVPMDQVNSTVIAMTFEPDFNDSSSYRTTFVQQGLLTHNTADSNNYPLYRYQGDDPSGIAPAVKYDLVLDTDAHFIQNGDTFEVDAYFNEELESNSIVVTYTFDGDIFEYEGFTAADGVTVFNATPGAGYVTLMLGLTNGYEMKDLGKLALKATDSFTGYQDIQAWAQLALKNEAGEKELVGATGITSVVCYEAPEFYTVVDLSNIIDWVGITNKDPQWKIKYVFYDFDNNGIIEIYDVAFLSKLVKAI